MELCDFDSRCRPVLKWAGGKSSLIDKLSPLFPPACQRYFEPFLGGGAVFLALRPGAYPAVLSDANPELIELYQVVRDTPARLMDALDCLATRYSEEFYYQMRSSQPEDPVERAARAVFLNKTGFNGLYRQNSKGHFNVPFGKRVSCPALYVRRHLLALSERLQEVTLLCSDFESVIDRAGPGDFVYCDPPYEPLSASSSFNAYKAGGFGQLEQRRLRDACARAARRGANLLVSNSAAPLIRELYKDWVIHELLARRAINSNGSGRGEITELAVWIGPEQNDAHNQKLSVDLAVPRTGIVELNSVLV